jgi:hypothetical protein
LVKGRYGERISEDGYSYTEFEVRLATEQRIPRLCFFLPAEEAPDPELEGFKKRLQAQKDIATTDCEDDVDLILKLMDSMQREMSYVLSGSLRDRLQFALREQYALLEEIGRGEMAIVFKAKARDGKAAPIAVRVVSHHFEHDGASHQQSTQSLVTSHMEGDGFVRVYSHEVIPLLDIEYWLMEYVRSVSLRQVMPTLGKFPVVLTLNYLYKSLRCSRVPITTVSLMATSILGTSTSMNASAFISPRLSKEPVSAVVSYTLATRYDT